MNPPLLKITRNAVRLKHPSFIDAEKVVF